MVDKGNKDQHRYSLPGVKGRVVETGKWGRDTAAKRYGEPASPNMKPKDESQPQDPTAKHGPGYSNDHRNDWVTGAGETAEKMPGYGRSKPREK